MIGEAIGARALTDSGAATPQGGKRGGVSVPERDARAAVVRREARRGVARAGEKQSWA